MPSTSFGSLPYSRLAQNASVDESLEKEDIYSCKKTRLIQRCGFAILALLITPLAGITGYLIGNQTLSGEPRSGSPTDTVLQGSAFPSKATYILTHIVWLSPDRLVQGYLSV